MKSLKELKNIQGKKVLLRVDFNVPMQDGEIKDDFRIQKSLETIKFLQNAGAKIILISHLGREGESLAPVARALNKYVKAGFVDDILGEQAQAAINTMRNGDILLLENLRKEEGEKSGSEIFAQKLASLADVYVNEAFSVSHRKDASVFILPKFLPAYAGIQFLLEIEHLSKSFENPVRPFLFILGGAKFSTKIPLIKKYLEIADYVFVGGALSNDLLKAKGYEVGKSLVDGEEYDAQEILNNPRLLLPTDVTVESGENLCNKKVQSVLDYETIIDMGIESTQNLSSIIEKSKLVVWNGPLGRYEKYGDKATDAILRKIKETKCTSVIGGGDLVSLVDSERDYSFVSTGGGAMIDFLSEKTLPGIEALG